MRVLLIALALAAAAFAGCGSDDDNGGGGGGGDVAEAKQKLVDSCHRGNEDDPDDLKLCQCVGDHLAKEGGFTTAEQFDKARETVEDGSVPKEVQDAVNACQAQQQ